MEKTQADLSATEALARKVQLKNLLDAGIEIDNMMPQQSKEYTLNAIRNIIEVSDNIIAEGDVRDRTEHTTEVVMDAQVLKMNHELLSKVMLQNADFNDFVYQNAIISTIQKTNDECDWDVIASIACKIAHTTRIKSSMLGVAEIEPKQHVPKERQQRKKTILAAEKRPEAVEELTRKDKGAQKVNLVMEQVSQLYKANDCQPIPFFKLIIDPNNFMNTVENCFQISFLVRDNLIGIEEGEDKYPQVRLLSRKERAVEKDTSQAICSLNMALCKKMIDYYNIREPMLKPQSEPEDQ